MSDASLRADSAPSATSTKIAPRRREARTFWRLQYRVLAYLIAAGVVLQAAAIAYGVFGMFEWVAAGGTIDKALIESESPQIGGIAGFNLHHLVGVNILPLLALLFLISSFFARIPGGIRWGLIVFAATLAQSLLGIFAHENSAVGWVHGATALILFTCALVSGIRVNRALAKRALTSSPESANAAQPAHLQDT